MGTEAMQAEAGPGRSQVPRRDGPARLTMGAGRMTPSHSSGASGRDGMVSSTSQLLGNTVGGRHTAVEPVAISWASRVQAAPGKAKPEVWHFKLNRESEMTALSDHFPARAPPCSAEQVAVTPKHWGQGGSRSSSQSLHAPVAHSYLLSRGQHAVHAVGTL